MYVAIHGKHVTMELDAGAAVLLFSERTYQLFFPELTLKKVRRQVKITYSGEDTAVLGQTKVAIKYEHQDKALLC